ncbi:MAG: Sulfite reductase [NADPH] flavoprotein alpha-component [Chlamydiales bacterium]|nr:Sulfite reductase [NADPH] flavoprotein alpha-component [Chlamydiales bacterium]
MSTLKSKQLDQAFFACIKERVRLNPGSEKETYHVVLDLKGSGIEYSVGDCIGIYPENDPTYVSTLVEKLKAPSIHDFLLKKANLHRIPKKLLGEHPDLLTLVNYQTVEPEKLCEGLLPLLPRFYSIASSQKLVGDEVHLTIALTKNAPGAPVPYGTCSDYLCRRAPLFEPVIPLFLQPSRHFCLPPESKEFPIIMIGPGTGVAPFRGFMQERKHARNWLFFGERNEKKDYYYQPFWHALAAKKSLKIDCAFSRDQKNKVYVQHKMYEQKAELWKWLQEGAYLFVCGDASKMAKDVDKILHQIVEQEGNLSSIDAKLYIKKLKKERRYQRDVY